MTISTTALAMLVTAALVVTILAPVILIGLFIKDRNKGRLW